MPLLLSLWKKRWHNFAVCLFIGLLFASACEEDASIKNDALNPGGELQLLKIDSISVESKTVAEDPLSGKNLNDVVLGTIQDARFGVFNASFYTQIELSVNAFEPGANAIADSLVLSIAYDQTYGPLLQPQDIYVYELLSALDEESAYDNDAVFNISSQPIGSSIQTTIDETAGIITIRMDLSFAQTLLDQFGTSVMESSDNFKDYFYGMYVTARSTAPGDGILYGNLLNDQSKMSLYFHSDTPSDSMYLFEFGGETVRVNQYLHELDGSEADQAINNEDNSVLYVAPFSSVKGELTLPNLSELDQYVINKAELVFTQIDYNSTVATDFPEALTLFLYEVVDDTTLAFVPDFSINDPTSFGGEKILVETNAGMTHQYVFNITQYVQQLSSGNVNTPSQLYVTILSNNIGGRVTLGGGNHLDSPIQLNIYITKPE